MTYELHWGDIALYQIDCDGTEKKYGYYTCQWEANGDPYEILGRNADLMCEEFGISDFAALEHTKPEETNYIELPYKVTVSENHKPGDLIVVRAMIDKGDNGAYGKGIEEGGCFDILFVVAEKEPVEDTSEWSTIYFSNPHDNCFSEPKEQSFFGTLNGKDTLKFFVSDTINQRLFIDSVYHSSFIENLPSDNTWYYLQQLLEDSTYYFRRRRNVIDKTPIPYSGIPLQIYVTDTEGNIKDVFRKN